MHFVIYGGEYPDNKTRFGILFYRWGCHIGFNVPPAGAYQIMIDLKKRKRR